MTCDGVKLSDKLGDDTNQLKKDVVSELQRGFSTEMQYTDIARNISTLGNSSISRAMRIARTEGGRIQSKADLDCAYRAKELGCDTVKQWNATLDGKTRSSHQKLDKEWRELDEPFSNGLMYPGDPNGRAAEVCNCRCGVDDVPRWYVEKGGGQYRREGITGNIIECKNYAEFKEKYLSILTESDKIKTTAANGLKIETVSSHTLDRANERGVTNEAIIDALENPLFIRDVVTDDLGRKSQRFVGDAATVNVNPDTGKIATVWKTGEKTRKKYKKGK